MAKSNLPLSSGSQEKPSMIEKPPMFAFCLKPRGLELPHRGTKQRSQKRLPVGALSNGIGDADAFHSLGIFTLFFLFFFFNLLLLLCM